MNSIYAVTVTHAGGTPQRYSTEFQTDDQFAHGWRSVLAKARGAADVQCSCSGRGEKRLTIRRYDNDSLGLAKFPFTGAEHSADCRFYSPAAAEGGVSSYQPGVVAVTPTGGMRIRLSIGLKRLSAGEAAPKAPPTPARGPRKAQPAMTILGLLHLLWDTAELNTWHPAMSAKRTMAIVNWYVDKVAGEIKAAGIPLNTVLLLSDHLPNGQWARSNRTRVAEAVARQRRLLAVVQLASHSPNRESVMESQLAVAGFNGIPLLDMPKGLWQRTVARFPGAIAAWRQQHGVIAIVELEPKREGRYAQVVDLALMPITTTWIPVESSFERLIADKLIDEGRAFTKPLRFDAEQDAVFPDFLLRDTGADTPLEVFGRSDETYANRRAAKESHYRQAFGTNGWWYWDASADPAGNNLQPFPPPRRLRSS